MADLQEAVVGLVVVLGVVAMEALEEDHPVIQAAEDLVGLVVVVPIQEAS